MLMEIIHKKVQERLENDIDLIDIFQFPKQKWKKKDKVILENDDY